MNAPLQHVGAHHIGGTWRKAREQADVIAAHTEELFTRVGLADTADMAQAVAAARLAFDTGPWPRMAPVERAGMLRALADQLDAHIDSFAHAWTHEVGVPHQMARLSHGYNSGMFRYYADLASRFAFEERHEPSSGGGVGILRREPVGVVAAIIPWNAPLMLVAIKAAPALIAGCTLVIKASAEAPVEALLFAQACEQVGLPPGVVNVITAGREVSEQLVRHPDVDKVSFTGSVATGRKVAAACGERIARCTLELGGKSAAIVLDDYDIPTVAGHLADTLLPMTGQACSLLTRIIVSRQRHDELVEAMAAAFQAIRVGDPYAPDTDMGPLATRIHRDRVEGYIVKGVAEGATLAAGGRRPPGLSRGWYVEPTLFADVRPDHVVAQEEIFGPVLSVMPADSDEEAIQIANGTLFGLNSAIFTDDTDRAYEFAKRMQTGNVGHNGYRVDPNITFGGFKQSGLGREGGVDGLRAFLEAKTILLSGPPSAFDAPRTSTCRRA